MKKGGDSESTIIVGPSKSVLVYALHSLEYVLGLVRFRVFVPKLYYYYINLFLDHLEQTDLCPENSFCAYLLNYQRFGGK